VPQGQANNLTDLVRPRSKWLPRSERDLPPRLLKGRIDIALVAP